MELKPVAECLKAIYKFINERGAFGSATNARWAKESLDLLIYDMETEEYKKSIIKVSVYKADKFTDTPDFEHG